MDGQKASGNAKYHPWHYNGVHNQSYSWSRKWDGANFKAIVCWSVQPLYEWGGSAWPVDCVLWLYSQEYKMVERAFFHLIDVDIVNAYILYVTHCKQMNEKPRKHHKFRITLAQQLLVDAGAPYSGQQNGSQTSSLPTVSRLTERHFITPSDSSCTGKKEQHNCAVWRNNKYHT